MSIPEFKSELDVFSYEVLISVIFEGADKPIDLTRHTVQILLVNQFDEDIMPYIECKMALPRDIMYKMQEGYRKAKFVLNLASIAKDGEDEDPLPHKILSSEVCTALDIDNSPISGEEEKDEGFVSDHPITLYLFSQDHLKMSKSLNNRVYKETTIEKAIGCLFTKQSGKRQVLMNTPDNTQTYEQIFIPPTNLKNSIEWLQQQYGIYKNGLRLFFGFDYTWLLDRETERDCHPKPYPDDGYWKTVHIEVIDQVEDRPHDNDGSWDDFEAKLHRIRTSSQPVFEYAPTNNQELEGEHIQFASYSHQTQSEIDCTDGKFGDTSNDPSKEKEKYYWNKMSHNFSSAEFMKRLKETRKVITLSLPNVNYEYLTLDRRFYLAFSNPDSKKYEGDYRLSGLIVAFERTTAAIDFRMTSVCQFKKKK